MLRLLLCVALLGGPTTVLAHHKQTAPIVRLTSGGDATLPRLADFSITYALAVPVGSSHAIYRLPYNLAKTTLLSASGDPANPEASLSGRSVVFDSDGDPLASGDPGRQVYLVHGTVLSQVTHDPTGTSVNPCVSGTGTTIAWESSGDLATTGSTTRQVFVRGKIGGITQASTGNGVSGDAALTRTGSTLVFDSTSDPTTGADTGTSQIWVKTVIGGPATRVTQGAGPSRRPTIASAGRIVAFESTANLAGGGEDTGVSQIFVADLQTNTFAQITNDAGGCSGPSIDFQVRDWRVTFVCGGEGFYYQLIADKRYKLPIPGGTDTSAILAEGGTYFLVVSTTANLLSSGTTSGHEVYQLNLYKTSATAVPGLAVWFPSRGIK
jgi:hypothetical protein